MWWPFEEETQNQTKMDTCLELEHVFSLPWTLRMLVPSQTSRWNNSLTADMIRGKGRNVLEIPEATSTTHRIILPRTSRILSNAPLLVGVLHPQRAARRTDYPPHIKMRALSVEPLARHATNPWTLVDWNIFWGMGQAAISVRHLLPPQMWSNWAHWPVEFTTQIAQTSAVTTQKANILVLNQQTQQSFLSSLLAVQDANPATVPWISAIF